MVEPNTEQTSRLLLIPKSLNPFLETGYLFHLVESAWNLGDIGVL